MTMPFWYRFDIGNIMSCQYSSRYGSDLIRMEFGCLNNVGHSVSDRCLISTSSIPRWLSIDIDLTLFRYLGAGMPLQKLRKGVNTCNWNRNMSIFIQVYQPIPSTHSVGKYFNIHKSILVSFSVMFVNLCDRLITFSLIKRRLVVPQINNSVSRFNDYRNRSEPTVKHRCLPSKGWMVSVGTSINRWSTTYFLSIICNPWSLVMKQWHTLCILQHSYGEKCTTFNSTLPRAFNSTKLVHFIKCICVLFLDRVTVYGNSAIRENHTGISLELLVSTRTLSSSVTYLGNWETQITR